MATQRTATDVAEMESDLVLAQAEIQSLRTQVAVLTQENGNLKVSLALAEGIAREEMIRATQMETIMSQVSMGLVAGLNKVKDKKQAERDARRLSQERGLGVGDGKEPAFVSRPMADGGFVQPRERGAGTLIAEAGGSDARRPSPVLLRQPMERLRGDRMPSGAPIDHPLLPRVDARSDVDELRDLGEQMIPKAGES